MGFFSKKNKGGEPSDSTPIAEYQRIGEDPAPEADGIDHYDDRQEPIGRDKGAEVFRAKFRQLVGELATDCLLSAVRKDVAFDAIIRQELIKRQVNGGGTVSKQSQEIFWKQFGWSGTPGVFVCIPDADFTREA